MTPAMEPSTWLRLALTVVVLFTRSNGAPYGFEEPYGGRNDPHITPTDDWKGNVGGHEVVKHLGNIGIVPDWGDSTHKSPLPVDKGWQPNPRDSHAGHNDETHVPGWTDNSHVSPLPVNEGWRPKPADMHATQVGVAPRSSPVVVRLENINIIRDLKDHSPLDGHQRPAGTGRSSKGWPSKLSFEENDSGSKDSGSNSKSDCHSKKCHSGSKESGSKEWHHSSKGSGSRESHHGSKHSKERKSHEHHHRSKHSKERKSHEDYHHGTYKHH